MDKPLERLFDHKNLINPDIYAPTLTAEHYIMSRSHINIYHSVVSVVPYVSEGWKPCLTE